MSFISEHFEFKLLRLLKTVVSNFKRVLLFLLFLIRSTKNALEDLDSKCSPFADRQACFIVEWSDFAGDSSWDQISFN